MLAMISLAPFAQGCGNTPDAPDPIAGRDSALRVISDPGIPTSPSDPPPTRPPRPPSAAPQYADLKAVGTMRMFPLPDGRLEVWLNVRNIGNLDATGPGTVTIGDYTASGPLSQYAGSPAPKGPNDLVPTASGWITLDLPANALARCRSYLTQIDTGRVMQGATAGGPDVFANDVSRVVSPCLEWTTPITEENVEYTNSLILGKSLMQIVSSQTVGRASDGKLCSECHYRDGGLPYAPPVDRGGTAPIWPYDVIDVVNGRAWAGPNGFAQGFLQQPTDEPDKWNSKPFILKMLVETWISDGERVTATVAPDSPLSVAP